MGRDVFNMILVAEIVAHFVKIVDARRIGPVASRVFFHW